MKYAIDIRWMIGSFRGMGRYAWQLIDPIKSDTKALGPAGTELTSLASIYSGHSFFPYWEQVVQAFLVKRERVEYLICPYNTGPIFTPRGVKRVLVVHDLIYMKPFDELPLSISVYQTLGRMYRRFIVPRIIEKADYIIAVSEFTKKEILERYKPKTEVVVIPNSVSPEWLDYEVKPLEKRMAYFITVAGEAPSKNLSRLLEAFSSYVNETKDPFTLKVVGINARHHSKFVAISKELGVERYVEFVGYVTNEQLMSLYGNAKGFIFASLFEGFGIPLIEAMATGTPIACSDTTSLPEVVGDCGYLFSPYSVESIKNGFLHLSQSHEFLELGVRQGLCRIEKYSETSVGNQFKEFWSTLDGK
ncbi:glycosyltransferase family 4 protein [Grimontia indica]|uniref:glycosyltransferase family 4 protein n=1 Tax=Grimontia indica TaxID=1056512 RepID=UPI0002AE6DB1|nr:glycosyltransferase family 1 protein [Grimontia indica]